MLDLVDFSQKLLPKVDYVCGHSSAIYYPIELGFGLWLIRTATMSSTKGVGLDAIWGHITEL